MDFSLPLCVLFPSGACAGNEPQLQVIGKKRCMEVVVVSVESLHENINISLA